VEDYIVKASETERGERELYRGPDPQAARDALEKAAQNPAYSGFKAPSSPWRQRIRWLS